MMLACAPFFHPLTPNLADLSQKLHTLRDLYGEFSLVALTPFLIYPNGALCSLNVTDPRFVLGDNDDYPCELHFELGEIARSIPYERYDISQLDRLDTWASLASLIVDNSVVAFVHEHTRALRLRQLLN